ncbi:hypothetical protein CEXT_299291 [Caerostris extrusa]|uniref:Uncharacterized protein n=1 Tax=Caerostris extrusa TaxID=172846 RepID=A0AAV4Q0P7_CAEEX|nr:hypothetical protein CEXT_299291 [Caerostris extrusa]
MWTIQKIVRDINGNQPLCLKKTDMLSLRPCRNIQSRNSPTVWNLDHLRNGNVNKDCLIRSVRKVTIAMASTFPVAGVGITQVVCLTTNMEHALLLNIAC